MPRAVERADLRAQPQAVGMLEAEADDHEVEIAARQAAAERALRIAPHDSTSMLGRTAHLDDAVGRARHGRRRARMRPRSPELIEPDARIVAAMPICSSVEARISISSVSILRRARFFTRVIERDVVDRLGQEVVGARLEAPAPVGRLIERGDHDRPGCAACADSALSRRQTSKPSMPGIITSSSTTSTRSRAQISSAS